MSEEKGHFRCYIQKNFRAETLALIGKANEIIAEYEAQGFSLTLRQLYYQFVARGLLANKQENYNMLGNVISDARLAGLVSWLAIEDRTRNLRGRGYHESPHEAVRAARNGYARDLWEDQPCRPEVWIEKDALVGVISGICADLRVNFFACRGYNSQSEQWRAGQRFARYYQKGQRPIVFHLGDHDPSGVDMTRDNQERLSMFAGVQVQVIRLALNYEQVERYNPPPNPTKLTDSRAKGYIEKYGESCWELDALEPTVISNLISSAIGAFRDQALWDVSLQREAAEKNELDIILEGMQ